MSENEVKRRARKEISRRKMLMRLGIAAGAAYAAPVLTGLSSGSASSFSSFSPVRRQTVRAPAPPPEIVVTVPEAADVDLIAAQGYGLLERDRLGLVDAEIARFALPSDRTIEQARTEILQLVPGAVIDPNHIYRASEFACGEDGCEAFSIAGWATGRACDADIALGMIDTGVNIGHEALAGVEIDTSSVVGSDRRPSSKVHGTAVAVLVAGRADTRTPGLLANVRLVAVDAFHADAGGQDAGDAFDVARALDRLSMQGVTVINLSFSGPANLVLERVVGAALSQDIVLVAAAGNAGPYAEPLYPAAYEGVVAVTAIDHRSNPWRQAASGAHIDFAAPGVRLWTAASVSGGRFRSGTSYAAPFVSAALAIARAADPAATGRQTVERLASGAVDLGPAGRDATFGWGLVQAPAACAAESDVFLPASGGGT